MNTPLPLAITGAITIPALIALLFSELLAIGVFFRLRSRNRRLYRALLLDPFKDVQWTAELHELCSEADMVLVRRVRRLRSVRQIALLLILGAVAIGAILEVLGF